MQARGKADQHFRAIRERNDIDNCRGLRNRLDFCDFGLQQIYAFVLEIIFQLGRFEQLRGIARFEEHPVEIGGIFRRISAL